MADVREVDAVEAVLDGEADVDESVRKVRDDEVGASWARENQRFRSKDRGGGDSHPDPMRSTAPA